MMMSTSRWNRGVAVGMEEVVAWQVEREEERSSWT
jgi:hypothetical protein